MPGVSAPSSPSHATGLSAIRKKIERWARTLVAISRAAVIVFLFACPLIAADQARGDRPTIQDVEAVYLYRFAQFVSWPPDAQRRPFTICTVGEPEVNQAVAAATRGEHIGGRAIDARLLSPGENPDACSILFLHGSKQETSVLGQLDQHPVLTVSDSPTFLDHGGIIQFETVNDRVRFSIQLANAKKAHLGLSSELLKVAVRVVGGPSELAQ